MLNSDLGVVSCVGSSGRFGINIVVMPGPARASVDVDALLQRQKQVKHDIRSLMGDVTATTEITPPLTAPVPIKRKKGQAVSLFELPPVPDKIDTHWDYLLKEMQWYVAWFEIRDAHNSK